jgi:hypothetical protein
MVTSGNISTSSGIGKFPLDPISPPQTPPFPEQEVNLNRAITVQYAGLFGVKSPPLGFKRSQKGVFLGVFWGLRGWCRASLFNG